jgi:long-chain acyl-CoA synthetase
VLVDGELRTGDVGARDAEGFLTVHGARRELLHTAGGRTLAPVHLEAALRGEPLIQDAVVLADRRRTPCALIVVDEAFAHELGLAGDLHDNEIVRERVDDQVRRVNQALHPGTQIKHFVLLPRRLSVVDGELTAGLKPRRQHLEDKYAELLAEREPDAVPTAEQRAR